MSDVRLLIDAGNTRIKWSLERDGEVAAQGSLAHRDDPHWARHWTLRRQPARVLVGSVAGEGVDAALSAWCAAQGAPAPSFVAVRRECLGLRVGYERVERLGVDRFLALLGARGLIETAVCVADVGTAVTLDAVGEDGVHLGGLIAPGPDTMAASLAAGTARIDAQGAGVPPSPFARDTGAAVRAGSGYAVAALIDRFADEAAARIGARATLLLTGGARFDVLPLLRNPGQDVPDLVLRGLRAWDDHDIG